VVGQEQRMRAGGGAGAGGERSRAAAVEGGVVAGVQYTTMQISKNNELVLVTLYATWHIENEIKFFYMRLYSIIC
jgi:hypothetical protein